MLSNHPSVLGSGGGTAYNIIGGTGLFDDGTAAAPSISFAADSDTGFYRLAGNAIGIALGGAGKGNFQDSGGLIFQGSSGSLLQFINAGQIVLAASGTNQNITLTPSGTGRVQCGATTDGPTATPLVISAGGTYMSGGTFSASLKIRSYDGSGGLAGIGADTVGMVIGSSYAAPLCFYTDGVEAVRILTNRRVAIGGTTTDSGALLQIGASLATGIASAGLCLGGADTCLSRSAAGRLDFSGTGVAAPQFRMISNGGNGSSFYFDNTTLTLDAGGSVMRLQTSATTALTIDASQKVTFAGAALHPDGTAAAPSISFAAAPTTGFYKYNASTFGYTSSGVQSLLFGGDGVIYGANVGSTLYMPSVGGVILTAGGTNKNITLTPSGTGRVVLNPLYYAQIDASSGTDSVLQYLKSGVHKWESGVNSGDAYYIRNATSGTPQFNILGNGRTLLGTTTDSGALLQIGTDTSTSTGGAVFGTELFLYRRSTGSLALSRPGAGSYVGFRLMENSGGAVDFDVSSNNLTVTATNGSITLKSQNATALTLDASQNATFAGTVKPQLATTAGAPAYVKGAIYFDTTLNKLRVGGAAAWETITSV